MYKFNSELYTYNPIKGVCSHDCSYCFMKPMRHRFNLNPTLRLDQKELKVNLGKGRFIFVGSSTDVFASDVTEEWIIAVLDHLYDFPDNEYMLQSKNPARFLDFVNHKLYQDRKEKLIFCTTIESDINHPGVSKAPDIAERVEAMKELYALGFRTMITIEPIMDFTDVTTFADLLASIHPVQVNFGANTSKTVKLIEPTKVKILALIVELETRGIKVHCKSDLNRIIKQAQPATELTTKP